MHQSTLLAGFLRWLLLIVVLGRVGAEDAPPPSGSGPVRNGSFHWSSTVQEAKAEPMGRFVTFAFGLTNVSDQTASILGTESSCECTVAELPSKPWVFAPGESGTIHVRMNIVGRFGTVTKVVAVETSQGIQQLLVRAKIPVTPAPFNVSPRKMDMEAARKDRQVVFKGGCAACHALPAIGRHGKDLFTKACAICHLAEHRAEMVPDLAALNRPKDAAYWRDMVLHGREGTLMPAFGKEAGGPLEPAQVDSLVEYLLQAYPAAGANAKPGESER